MIEFKNIKFRNFLSYGNEWTDISLNKADTTLVKGTNGNGKSTFLDAITYGLFGKGFRKTGMADLINNANKKGLMVEVEFVVKGKHYKIERGMRPATFNIFIDGKQRHNDAKIKDQQVWLEQNVLSMSEKSFRQIVVLGTGNYTPFMRLPVGDRRKVIEQLLDIEIFGMMNDILKKRASGVRSEVSNAEHEIALINTKIESTKRHIEAVKTKAKISKDKAHTEVANLQSKIAELLIDNENLILNDVSDLREKQDKIRTIQTQSESKMKQSQKSIKLFSTKDQCPTCDQGISSDFKAEMIEHHNKIKDELEINLDKMDVMYDSISNSINEHNAISSKHDTNNQEISKLQSIIERIQAAVEDQDTTVDENLETELSTNQADVYKKQKVLYTLINKSKLFTTIEVMLKDGGIKSRIIKKYLPVLNTIINKYLKEFEFNITLTLDELFNESVTKNGRELYGYSGFSEGEKLRIDMAILFSFRELSKLKNSLSTNILVLDEILDSSLDRPGIENFMKIIREQESTKMFVISHKGEMEDQFKRTIKVTKTGQFSQISETIL